MSPLTDLKKGLRQLQKQVKKRRDMLLADMAAKKPLSEAQEIGLLNDGVDDIDDDAVVEARPTRTQTMQAASTIKKYIAEMNDSVARDVEELLGKLATHLRLDEARNLRETLVTDYFTHQETPSPSS